MRDKDLVGMVVMVILAAIVVGVGVVYTKPLQASWNASAMKPVTVEHDGHQFIVIATPGEGGVAMIHHPTCKHPHCYREQCARER